MELKKKHIKRYHILKLFNIDIQAKHIKETITSFTEWRNLTY